MRQPKIIDELNDSVVTVIQLVLTIHNSKGNGKGSFAADELTGLIWAAALMRPSNWLLMPERDRGCYGCTCK